MGHVGLAAIELRARVSRVSWDGRGADRGRDGTGRVILNLFGGAAMTKRRRM